MKIPVSSLGFLPTDSELCSAGIGILLTPLITARRGHWNTRHLCLAAPGDSPQPADGGSSMPPAPMAWALERPRPDAAATPPAPKAGLSASEATQPGRERLFWLAETTLCLPDTTLSPRGPALSVTEAIQSLADTILSIADTTHSLTEANLSATGTPPSLTGTTHSLTDATESVPLLSISGRQSACSGTKTPPPTRIQHSKPWQKPRSPGMALTRKGSLCAGIRPA